MNVPFEPEETHDGPGREDPFDDNSVTWGAADPDFDRMLRERIGPPPTMPTPPYAFERVLLAGRRRRARKVWTAGAAAALVVMAGTAGTTVALHGAPTGGVAAPPAGASQSTTQLISAPATGVSVTPSPSASATPTPSATSPSAAPVSTSASPSVPQCHSDDLQLTVTVQSGNALLIVLRNNSAHTCTTYGYPGLQTETVNEQLQSTTVTRINHGQVAHLTVGPGQYISTLAGYAAPPAGSTASPGAGCGAPSYYLAVIPPNEQSQIAATIEGGPVTICGNGVLKTDPLVMGKTGGQ